MIEDVQQVRWKTVERMNGPIVTWWHYNRVTLAIGLWIVCALMWDWRGEHQRRTTAEADNVVLAAAPSMGCYEKERSTTLIIAGGNQQVVDNALRQATYQIDTIRGQWIVARDRARRATEQGAAP